jgi:LacI family transcriptional regulator
MKADASRPTKRATIKEVAEACDVHPSTVSRALNAATARLIAPDVAARIRSVADTLGYRPNAVAAGLRTGRSRLIGVLAPDISDPGFPPILGGLAEELGRQGYVAVVADLEGDGARQRELVDRLIAQGVDGLVLATVRLDDPIIRRCLDARIPAVLVNRADRRGRLASVVSDDIKGMALAVEHLVGLGHRRIGHIAGPSDLSTGALRRQGFEAAIVAAGVEDSAVETARAYTRAEGKAAAMRLLARAPRPTAIVAANDLLALGAYDAIAASGLACPQHVSVVGHNDMPYVDMLAPPLTTVRIRQRDLGRAAASRLLEAITAPPKRKQQTMFDPQLIVRGSTAKPPRG